MVLGAFTSPEDLSRGTEWLLCAQTATLDAPTLSEVPQARTSRKPFPKLCLAFRRLTLVLSHQSNAPQLAGGLLQEKNTKQLQRSQTSFPEKSGVFQGVLPLAAARLCGMEVPHSSQNLCKAPSSSPATESPQHTFGAVYRMDDDNVFLLNKIHF